MGKADFDWLDGLRRAHFPPERNFLRAHITLFHHLPPSLEAEAAQRLKQACREPPPLARLVSPINMGRGVAYRIESEGLLNIRAGLAEAFDTALIPQDRAPWRLHVTVQNKVSPELAKELLRRLERDFIPAELEIAGLGLFRYLGGPWQVVGGWRFGNGHRMEPPA